MKIKKEKTNSQYRKLCVAVAKKIVRIRDKETCQKCGKKDGVLHCSHVYPEGTYNGLSANPLNMKLLCYRCHFFWWHKNIIEAHEWFKNKFPERFRLLKILSQKIIKIEWKSELAKLKEELDLSTRDNN